jgi:hypothetical protein
MPSDYDRCIKKSYNEAQRMRSSTASGKKVPRLREQEIQSIPPLKVLPFQDQDEEIARNPSMSAAQLIGEQDIPKAVLAWKFAPGQPLVRPERVRHLPTQMWRLHEWYMKVIKEGRQMLMVAVKNEHYLREDQLCIELEKLFQLYNQDAFDKSIICCYCL